MTFPILPLISFLVATSFTPGPNNLTSAALGMDGSYKKALPFIFGVYLGVSLILCIAGLLSLVIHDFFYKYVIIFKIAGTLYLLWLAITLMLKKDELKEYQKRSSFLKGLFLQIINPKTLFFAMTLHSLFFIELDLKLTLLLIISFAVPIVTFISTSTWAIAGTILYTRLKNPLHRRILFIIMGLFLVYTAMSILFTKF